MNKKLKAIDFFCSGGGMTCGMRLAGINVIAGIDIDSSVKETYEKNNPGAKFISKDIHDLTFDELQSETNIDKYDDNLIFIGCSPCQYWSILNTDKRKSSESKDLLKEFSVFVYHYMPGYVVVENVPGLMRKSQESGLDNFISELERLGYTVEYDVYKLEYYGVPQTRKRFSLIATRNSQTKIQIEKSAFKYTVGDIIGNRKIYPYVNAGHRDSSDFQHTVANLSNKNLEVIAKTPLDGGNSIKIRECFRGKGFNDSYSRMSWNKPAPTITTRFLSISNGRFGHPSDNRAISIREGASLQTFPTNYVFYSSNIHKIAQMIGNAVPPEFARRIGEAIINEHNR